MINRGFFVILRIILSTSSFFFLGAHFIRSGNPILALACILVPLIFIIKKRWSLIVLQLFAYLGAGIWIYTAIMLYQRRMMLGAPWGRMVIIMGAVAGFTFLAGLLLNSPKVKKKYP